MPVPASRLNRRTRMKPLSSEGGRDRSPQHSGARGYCHGTKLPLPKEPRMKRHASLTFLILVIVLSPCFSARAADGDDIALPNGTELLVRLTTTLSSKGSEEGDPWLGKVEQPIFAGGQETVPEDSKVHGHVTFVKPPGRATGRGEL